MSSQSLIVSCLMENFRISTSRLSCASRKGVVANFLHVIPIQDDAVLKCAVASLESTSQSVCCVCCMCYVLCVVLCACCVCVLCVRVACACCVLCVLCVVCCVCALEATHCQSNRDVLHARFSESKFVFSLLKKKSQCCNATVPTKEPGYKQKKEKSTLISRATRHAFVNASQRDNNCRTNCGTGAIRSNSHQRLIS